MCAATSRSSAPSSSRSAANDTVSRPGASQKTTVPQVRQRPRLASCSETAARSQARARLVLDDEIAPVRGGGRPRAARRLLAGVAVADEHVAHRPVDREAHGPAGAGSLAPHAGSAASRRSRSPSDVHQPHETRTSPLPGISRTCTSCCVERLDELGRIAAERGTRRAWSARPPAGSRARRGRRAGRGSARRPRPRARRPTRAALERGKQAGERRRRPPARVEAGSTGLRVERPVGLVLGL